MNVVSILLSLFCGVVGAFVMVSGWFGETRPEEVLGAPGWLIILVGFLLARTADLNK